MTRAERCFEFLRAKGFAHLASEIGWCGAPDEEPEKMSMVRPQRALSRDEAMVMAQVWQIAYEGSDDAVDVRNEEYLAYQLAELQRPMPSAQRPTTLIEVLARV